MSRRKAAIRMQRKREEEERRKTQTRAAKCLNCGAEYPLGATWCPKCNSEAVVVKP